MFPQVDLALHPSVAACARPVRRANELSRFRSVSRAAPWRKRRNTIPLSGRRKRILLHRCSVCEPPFAGI